MKVAPQNRTTFEFPSPEAAWGFAQQARELGHRVDLHGRVNLFAPGTHAAVWAGALIGGTLLALVGAFAETFALALPRLGPVFAAPIGAPTVLFALMGGSAGALIGGLLMLRRAPTHKADPARHDDQSMQPALVEVSGQDDMLGHMAMEWGGLATPEDAVAGRS